MRSVFPTERAIRAAAAKSAKASRSRRPQVGVSATELHLHWRYVAATEYTEQLFQLYRRCNAQNRRVIVSGLYEVATWALRRLGDLSSTGDEFAASLVELLAGQAIDKFHASLDRPSELARERFTEATKIPGYISVEADVIQYNKKLAARLGLGTRNGRNFIGKQASRRSGPTAAVIRLFEEMRQMRFWYAAHDFVKIPDGIYGEVGRTAAQLPLLSRATAADWCRVTWPLFNIRFGQNFEDHPLFREQAESQNHVPMRERRAAIRKLIRRQVQLAWRSIAARDLVGG